MTGSFESNEIKKYRYLEMNYKSNCFVVEHVYVQAVKFYALANHGFILWSNFLHDTGHIRDLSKSL